MGYTYRIPYISKTGSHKTKLLFCFVFKAPAINHSTAHIGRFWWILSNNYDAIYFLPFIFLYTRNPAGLNLEFDMSALSDLGGHWDVFFLHDVIA